MCCFLAADCTGGDALAILLTGTGDDGARGMKQLHDGGARTVAQDEVTCVVVGMPKQAIKLGVVDQGMSLNRSARNHAVRRKGLNGPGGVAPGGAEAASGLAQPICAAAEPAAPSSGSAA